jgi:hypothetical protein
MVFVTDHTFKIVSRCHGSVDKPTPDVRDQFAPQHDGDRCAHVFAARQLSFEDVTQRRKLVGRVTLND